VEVGQLTADLGGALAEVAVDQRPAAATRLPPVRRRLLVMACTGGSGVVDAGWM
jgi:chemotaxis regulatin CheY-phosphate phosphatase CheZ